MSSTLQTIATTAIKQVPVVGQVASIAAKLPVVGGIFGDQHPEDAGRLAANTDAFNKAQGGDVNAFLFLKYRTGKFGTGTVPGYGQVAGWATQSTKDDANKKYQAVRTLPKFVPIDNPGATAATMGLATLGTAAGLGTGALPWLLGALAVLVLFLILGRRRG